MFAWKLSRDAVQTATIPMMPDMKLLVDSRTQFPDHDEGQSIIHSWDEIYRKRFTAITLTGSGERVCEDPPGPPELFRCEDRSRVLYRTNERVPVTENIPFK